MSYNFFRDARSISNSFLCRYDNVDGYASDFSTNGDVNGWDLYNNIYLYGSWAGMIFGTSYDRECYIGRTNPFSYIEAETHYTIRIMMKITSNQNIKVGPTKGKVRWTRYGDTVWNLDKEYEFDIIADDGWHLYEINMGPAQWWQGNINNLRVYPFIDGWSGDSFAIKYIKISSSNTWSCTNTSCSYYSNYVHECPGAGSRGYCQAGESKTLYNTTEGIDDELIVNINDYGDLSFNIGTNLNLTGTEMARIINKYLSAFGIGAYAYASVEYTAIDDKLKIFSGTVGSSSSVIVKDSSAARALGFYDSIGVDISSYGIGTAPATGFDYTSSRLLTAMELNRLLNDDTEAPAYIHNPTQYSVEAGRKDFFMVGEGAKNRNYIKFTNRGTTLIDISHPFDNNGRIKAIYVYGVVLENTSSKAKIIRPKKDGSLTVVDEFYLPSYDPSYMYTATPVVYRVDCDALVQKGDYIGIYNMDVYVGKSFTGDPDAIFFLYNGDAVGTFDPGEINSYGLGGFPIYARSDRRQINTIIDIDMGERINIEEVEFYGEEYDAATEYNIASCLDVNWSVNLFGETHTHVIRNAYTGDMYNEYNDNIAVGTECLNDCIITADNGLAGDGLESLTGYHSYFYITGDAEWGYKNTCDGTTEYCGNLILINTMGYQRDPIEFTLTFPYGFKTTVHKSIMYFKESNNFRNFSLSTYRGPHDYMGNSDKPGYDYVPYYNTVALNGIEYTSEDNVGPYLFNNPCNSDYTIVGGVIENEEEYSSALATRWNVIEHNFDPVDCAGFRIYCNKHMSTKITELELYSSFDVDSSLSDNILLMFSSYGDLWSSASFSEISTKQINAFIGDSPRYFRIEIEAQNSFQLNSMISYVGDQVKIEDCDDNIYLRSSKTNAINDSYKLDIENVYDVPLELNVDIPRTNFETDDLIFWSTCDSETSLESPEIGPPSILRKREPYYLQNESNQCAINVPCYGLNNMVHDKKSYYQINESAWVEYGTLVSGTSLNYINYPDSKKTNISFYPSSGKFWKLTADHSSVNSDILGVSLFYEGNLIDINKVYFDVARGSVGGDYYSSSNENDSLDNYLEVSYSFGSGNLTSYFSFFAYDSADYLIETDDYIYPGYIFANSYMYLDYNLIGRLISFDAEFILENSDWNTGYYLDFNFTDASNNSVVRYSVGRNNGYVYNEGVYYTSVEPTFGNYEIKLRIIRRGDIWTFNFVDTATDGDILNWSWSDTLSGNAVEKLRVGFLNYDASGNGAHFISISNYSNYKLKSVNFEAAPNFSYNECIIVELYNSQPVDSILLFTNDSILPGELTLYTSNYNYGFYGYASEDGLGAYTTLASDYFNGTTLDTSIWNTFIEPNASVSVSGTLQLRNLTGNAHSGASCYTLNEFQTQNSIRISCKWKPHKDHYSSAEVPMIKLFSPSSSRNIYGVASTRFIGFRLGSTGDTTDRTMLRLLQGDVSGTQTIINSVAISIDETQWHDISIFMNLENGFSYIDLDGGTYYVEGTFSTDVIDSIGDTFKIEFTTSDYNKNNLEQFDEIVIRQALTNSYLYVTEDNYYINFAIDLENRHDLAIIRNYGTAANKLLLSLNNNVDFSNSFVNNPNDVIWGNSTYNDARWLRIKLLCGDGTTRYLRKLGIYPDIGTSICHNGGYNCSWYSLGTYLTDYTPPINVVNTVSDYSNYLYPYVPDNVIDGISDSSYWCFYNDGSDPYIEIDLGNNYNINKFILNLGAVDKNPVGLITAYTISISTVASGSVFTDVVSVTGNSYYERTHILDNYLDARRVKLTIDGFTEDVIRTIDASSGEYITHRVGYLRELQVWTSSYDKYINSETWPVVCMDLKNSFWLAGHELINKNTDDTGTDWDNAEEFFRYAESSRDDPKKVAFYAEGNYTNVYSTSMTSNDAVGNWEYVIDNEVYLHEGQYVVQWSHYDNNNENEISLRFEGNNTIEIFASVLSSSWASQEDTFFINNSGYYSIKGVQNIDNEDSWGIRNITIYKSEGHYRWIAITRDTAENYSYDDDSSKYGEDYLSKIKVYSRYDVSPTEYSWWWNSTNSTSSNDYIFVKEGARSLKIDYPTSSGIDVVRFIEGDTFGRDTHWSVKDSLSFWLYVDNVNNLDTSFGYISFGLMESDEPAYYTWYISNINISSGWNEIELQFEDADSVSISENYNRATNTFHSGLDFKNNDSDFESLQFVYRGTGNPFNMYIDSLKIKRCSFEPVKFDNGVSLFDNDFLEIPITGMSMDKGTIEFWYKFYTDTSGYDLFNRSATRTLFSATNNSNDFLSFIIAEHGWFQILVGNLRNVITLTLDENIRPSDYLFSIGDIAHFAVVWSNDGKFMSNGDTVRLYINNKKVLSYSDTWTLGDTKSFFLKFGGAVSQLSSFINEYDGCGVLDNVKLYNYCKTNFDINSESSVIEKRVSANKFIEISEDNVNFYGQGNSNLPLVFESVPVNDYRSVYIRSSKDDSFANSGKTANLLIEWVSIV